MSCLFMLILSLLREHAQDEMTALLWAAMEGHADCVRLLLDAGADKDAKNNVRNLPVSILRALLFGSATVSESEATELIVIDD